MTMTKSEYDLIIGSPEFQVFLQLDIGFWEKTMADHEVLAKDMTLTPQGRLNHMALVRFCITQLHQLYSDDPYPIGDSIQAT
jgi:hypothetical protein